jgi:hypothetical protein
MIRTRITTTIAAVMIAAVSAAPAFAGGEPKNDGPFVRPVAQSIVSGEPKNEAPFNGTVQEPPTVVVTTTGDGFSWIDAAIGAVAGIGATCVAAGLAVFALGTRRNAAAAQ